MVKNKPEVKENKNTREAYDLFFTLVFNGETMTSAVKQIAKEKKKNLRTIWNWYNKYGWKERYIKEEAEIEKANSRKRKKHASEKLATYEALLEVPLQQFTKLTKEEGSPPVEIRNIKDLVILIEALRGLQKPEQENIQKNLNVNLNNDIQQQDLFDEKTMKQILDEESTIINELEKQIQ